jgi:Protein kinase domain
MERRPSLRSVTISSAASDFILFIESSESAVKPNASRESTHRSADECKLQASIADLTRRATSHRPMASLRLMADLRPGDRLVDRYRVLHPISRGGMGAVYEAEDERLGRRVAIKVLLGESTQDASKMERFRREARATAAVTHPSLVGVYDLHLEGEPPFIVMELLAGESLHELLSQEGRLPSTQVVALAATLLDALASLHAIGVVHRDVKPANVIVSPDGTRATLIDLGVAQLTEGNLSRLTEAGAAVGTPAFMAPEQLTGDAIGPAADVWAMGVLLYLCLTGQLPFPAGNYAQLLGAVHLTQPTPIRQLAPQTPPEVDAFVQALLAKPVEQRPRDARDALARLRTSTSGAISVLQVTRSQSVVRSAPFAASRANLATVLPGAPMRAHPGERTQLASRSAMVTTIAALLAGLGILTTCVVGGLLGAVFTQTREASLVPGAPALPGVTLSAGLRSPPSRRHHRESCPAMVWSAEHSQCRAVGPRWAPTPSERRVDRPAPSGLE